jgi:thioesterase domain-containing protein/acyl carrier protein
MDTRMTVAEQVAALPPAERDRLLARLRARRAEEAGDTAIRPVPPGERVPLSFAQERMWFLHRSMPDRPVYHVAVVLRMEGPLDLAALGAAVTALVSRHEVLRTRFGTDGLGLHQVVDPAPEEVPLPATDLTGLPPDARRAAAMAGAAELVGAPLDLRDGPLVRAGSWRTGEREHLFVLCLHHALIDDWSVPILIGELSECYRAARAGTPPRLPDLPVRYRDYARWQRRALSGPALDRELDFWRERLAGLPDLRLPTDAPRPARPAWSGDTEVLTLPAGLHEQLAALAQAHHAPLLAVTYAALGAVLARHTGQDDLAVGSVFTGRTIRPEIESLIGFFSNTVVLRLAAGGDPTLGELLERAVRTVLEAHEHQEVPFEQVVAHLAPPRVPHRNPLFQVAIVAGNAPAGTLELDGLRLTPLDQPLGTSRFDLTLGSAPAADGGLLLTAEYSTELFRPERVRALLRDVADVLRLLVAEPERRLSGLDGVGAAPGGPADAGPPGPGPDPGVTELDEDLVDLWCDLLDLDEAGPDDDFFAAGGTSLQATALVAGVRERYGVSVELTDLLAGPTLRRLQSLLEAALVTGVAGGTDLLERIEQEAGPHSDVLVELRPGGDRPAVFLLHSSGGSTAPYAALTRFLAAGRPCWGVDAAGLHGGAMPGSVEEAADECADALLDVRPDGPHHLVGWSTGGVLAFAVAAELRRRGHRPGLVALLDSEPPPRLDAPPDEPELLALFALSLCQVTGRPPAGPSPEELRALPAAGRAQATIDRLVATGIAEDLADLRPRLDVFVNSLRLGATWRPRPQPGRLDLLLAAENPRAAAVAAGWRELAPDGLVEHRVPGDHYAILRPPGAAELARVLDRLLDAGEAA